MFNPYFQYVALIIYFFLARRLIYSHYYAIDIYLSVSMLEKEKKNGLFVKRKAGNQPQQKAKSTDSKKAKDAAPQGKGIDGLAIIVYNRLVDYLARSGLRYSVGLNFILGIAVIVCLFIIASLSNQEPPEPKYFATNPDGTIYELVALNKPLTIRANVLNWAGKTATKCYSFSFTSVERITRECEVDEFTKEGGKEYLNSLGVAGIFADVKENELTYETSMRSAPIIVDEGVISGRAAYNIKIPVFVRVTGPKTRPNSQNRTISIIALRVPTLENPAGLQVHQFVVE